MKGNSSKYPEYFYFIITVTIDIKSSMYTNIRGVLDPGVKFMSNFDPTIQKKTDPNQTIRKNRILIRIQSNYPDPQFFTNVLENAVQ